MNKLEYIEPRDQQSHRRLAELEIAVVIGGESGLAWHIIQAARSGASAAQVLDAVKLGVEMRGTSTPDLTQSALETVRKIFGVRGGSLATPQPGLLNV
jgi:alkylhydroperoxidase/carboxymuconolactone decarboxylase family protein YurZ